MGDPVVNENAPGQEPNAPDSGHSGVTEAPASPEVPQRKRLFGRWAVLSLALLAVIFALSCWLTWRTDDAMANMPFLHLKGSGNAANTQQNLVDQTPWQTATALTTLATTQEEMAFARQAERLADHEVDQAFASSLRAANLQQRTLTGAALALQGKVTQLEAEVTADQDAVKAATLKGGDDLDLAQAQLGFDQDELTDAKGDLARASGDQRTEIQQELTAHTADEKKFEASNGTGQNAVETAKQYRTLARFLGAYGRQNTRYALILEAKASAEHAVPTLTAQHNHLEKAASGGALPVGPQATGDRVASLKRSGQQRELMSLYDDRIDSEQQLVTVYDKWAGQVALQHRILRHLIAVQIDWIAGILIAATLASALVRLLTQRESLDPRRARTLARLARLAVQVVALVSVVLVIFGPPEQLSTVIGLTTAGLTVALQDFILAFVGWFMLMGRNGLGVGDVVEINSVTGEVVDIGLFRTTLLETGNWTAKGHPTGRRVDFNNKYAISGQYFNFSTAGQWMWDEMTVSVPSGEDVGAAIERVHKAVAAETESDARLAETEWRRSSKHYSLSQFSADPDVNVRPSSSGVDLVVRYVTRATDRFGRRNKLYQCVLDAVRQPSPAPAQ